VTAAYVGPFGLPYEFQHIRTFPPAELRVAVRPNFDTLYSIAWLDLTAGPVVVHASDTDDRWYMLEMIDKVWARPVLQVGSGPQE